MKKIVSLLLAIVACTSLSMSIYAHDAPNPSTGAPDHLDELLADINFDELSVGDRVELKDGSYLTYEGEVESLTRGPACCGRPNWEAYSLSSCMTFSPGCNVETRYYKKCKNCGAKEEYKYPTYKTCPRHN